MLNVVLRVGEGARLKNQLRCLVELHNCSDWKSRLEEKSLKQQGRQSWLWHGGWCVVSVGVGEKEEPASVKSNVLGLWTSG